MIVTGAALLANETRLLQVSTNVIHQTMPAHRLLRETTWTTCYPNALHVRWSDNDNRALVSRWYPRYLQLFDNLELTVQRTDLVRLLYLHRYAGLYVDEDYECRGDVLGSFHGDAHPLRIVRSRTLLNEVLQNSFMHASHTRHPYFLACVHTIAEIQSFVERGCEISYSCLLLRLLHSPLTRGVVNVAITQYMTGPAVLDKTLVLHPQFAKEVRILPCDVYFVGTLARHRHDNSWVKLPPLIRFLLFGLFLPCLLCLPCLASCSFMTRPHRFADWVDDTVPFMQHSSRSHDCSSQEARS